MNLTSDRKLYYLLNNRRHATGRKRYEVALFLCHVMRHHHSFDARVLDHLESEEMPNKRSKMDWEIVSCRLSPDVRPQIEAWYKATGLNAFELLEELGNEGYKISVRYVIDSSAWCVSLSGNSDTMHNDNKTLTSWAADLEEAIAMSAYKHRVIFHSAAWTSDATPSSWG